MVSWIDKLNILVNKLQWFKPISILLAIGFAALAGFIVFTNTGIAQNDKYLLPSAVGMVWSILVYGVLTSFAVIPAEPDMSLSWFKRVKIRFVRGYYWLLFWMCVATTLVAAHLSLRAITI